MRPRTWHGSPGRGKLRRNSWFSRVMVRGLVHADAECAHLVGLEIDLLAHDAANQVAWPTRDGFQPLRMMWSAKVVSSRRCAYRKSSAMR